ncbi:MAG: hypothetical protein B7Y45_14120 [Sphingomonas sp. 28-66-16]|nr:MAG: hypothetical protein B7Y45_14120 [Sphingomonas sp. 28-66-16]
MNDPMAFSTPHVVMPPAPVVDTPASTEELLRWASAAVGGPITDWHQISGGNRYQSFTISARDADDEERRYYLRYQLPRSVSVEPYTVLREVAFYRLLEKSGVPAARLVAVNTDLPAVLLEHVDGIAEYRRLVDIAERETIAMEFTDALSTLHGTPFDLRIFPDADRRRTLPDCAAAEIADWKAMYDEVAVREPLIETSLRWLADNVSPAEGAPVLVHGDAGPGNFLFKGGHLSAIIDWEFAHPGDWHDDLAWFSMRCVMEPVPDFPACLRRYEMQSGRTIDVRRLRFYQVLVSTRVLIVRHRNVSGEHGNSIVSRALNRRLLTAALAAANDIVLAPFVLADVPPTDQTELYDFVIAGLRDDISSRSDDKHVAASSKNLAKIVKFLREIDRYGVILERSEMARLAAVLGDEPSSRNSGYLALSSAVSAGAIEFEVALRVFAEGARCDAILAASASGRIANRTWPDVE